MISPPKGWSPGWQAALVNAALGIICYRVGLTSEEFAALAGVSSGVVDDYATSGLANFRKRFGSECSFERVRDSKFQIVRRVFTFSGVITPLASRPPLPGLMSLPEFCQQQKEKDWLVRQESRKSHRAFRRRFPGWDFVEMRHPLSGNTARWFGRIEYIGEQPDLCLDETSLTIYKFAALVDVHRDTVRRYRQKGLHHFDQRFPGWSFRQEGKKVVYFRKPSEESNAPQMLE